MSKLHKELQNTDGLKLGHGWNKGKQHTKEQKEKLSLIRRGKFVGKKHWNWQGGKSKEYKRARVNYKYKDWRNRVFERDDFTCQECGLKGVYLEPHHIKPFSTNKNLRYDVNNGITLCVECHCKIDKHRAKFVKDN